MAGVILIHLFSILAYVTLGSSFDDEEGELHYCSSLLYCWGNIISRGLPQGDIGELMAGRLSTSDPKLVWQMAFETIFWIVVITVLMNVIFGIIIDTFGELRTSKEAIKQSMQNTCFVCLVDRFTLDTKGGGFEQHLRHDHNLWHYLFMIVHVREKDTTEHNGWEAYVAQQLQRGDLSFFPRNKSISLAEVKQIEDAERNVFAEQQQAILDSMHDLKKMLLSQEKRIDALMDAQGGWGGMHEGSQSESPTPRAMPRATPRASPRAAVVPQAQRELWPQQARGDEDVSLGQSMDASTRFELIVPPSQPSGAQALALHPAGRGDNLPLPPPPPSPASDAFEQQSYIQRTHNIRQVVTGADLAALSQRRFSGDL